MRTDRRTPRHVRPLRRVLALLLAPIVLVACGGSDRIEWTGARIDLPVGWEVVSSGADRLVLADHLGSEGERGVQVTFLRIPGTLPAEWRQRVAERGATLESDSAVLIAGDVPATQLVLLDEIEGTPIREVILVVASRGLIIAITPSLEPGDQDGPRVLLDSLDGVRELLDTIELAPPPSG
jgi:hypothetical protein